MESGMSGMGVYHSAERTFKARQHVSSSIHGLHSEIWAKFQGFSRHFFRGFQGLRDFHGFFLPSFRPEENGGRGGGVGDWFLRIRYRDAGRLRRRQGMISRD